MCPYSVPSSVSDECETGLDYMYDPSPEIREDYASTKAHGGITPHNRVLRSNYSALRVLA